MRSNLLANFAETCQIGGSYALIIVHGVLEDIRGHLPLSFPDRSIAKVRFGVGCFKVPKGLVTHTRSSTQLQFMHIEKKNAMRHTKNFSGLGFVISL